MLLRRVRFTIGGMMGVVALVALGCALVRWVGWEGALVLTYPVGWAGVMAGATLGLAKGAGIARGRAAAWACAIYPWVILGTIALGMLLDWWRRTQVGVALPGSRPFALVAEALGVAAGLLGMGLPLAGLGSLVLAIGRGVGAAERRGADQGEQVARAVLIPLFLWIGALLVTALGVAWLVR